MKCFVVYMLQCSDGSYYVGHTDDIGVRLSQHRLGKGCYYTKTRLPVELVWSQPFSTRNEALIAERKIKRWTRDKKEALVKNDWDTISEFGSRAKDKED